MVVGPDRGLSQPTVKPGSRQGRHPDRERSPDPRAHGRSHLEVAAGEPDGDERSVTVWNDRCRAVSAGPEAAEWFSSLLGSPCELVRQPDAGVRQVDRRFADEGDRVAFADGFPFLLISQGLGG